MAMKKATAMDSVVAGEKEGRVVRYRVVDEDVRLLLKHCVADGS